MNRQSSDPLYLILLLAILLPVEVFCGLLAYETIGEVTSGIYMLGIIVLNGLLIVLYFRHRRAALLGLLVVALLIVPYQLALGDRLLRVQAEVTRIVAYAYETRTASGAFPADLAAYTYSDPDVQPYVQGYLLDETGQHFTVTYFVGTPTASHWYDSFTSWGYYPD